MKPQSNTATNRNAHDSNHPPLARDGYGNPLAIPDGTAAWRLKRETGGRPKMIVGTDRQPARFPLDATADDIESMVGAGTYRVYAIGADGDVLDYVTTVNLGEGPPPEAGSTPVPVGPPRGPTSDLRFALETILQMSRAQSDSLRAVATAQADWVKGLASAKALPRNGYAPVAPPVTYSARDEDDDDEDDEDDDDTDDKPAAPSVASQVLEILSPLVPMLQQNFGEMLRRPKGAPKTPAPTDSERPRNASATPSPPNAMIHLSEINIRLTALERKFLNVVLRGQDGGLLANMLLEMSADDAAKFLKEQIARVQIERGAPVNGGATTRAASPPPVAEPHADGSQTDEPAADESSSDTPEHEATAAEFMSRVMAAAAHLTAEERATVLWLVPRFPAERLEELQRHLLQMTPRDAARWIRANLPALRAEVSS